jgi:propionyl-CoA carboxylase alpha chain
MYGADMPCLIQSPREFELTQYMHAPVHVDTSDFVLSPMPGTLIGYSVKEGDVVELDQELCIVEAMKMQNIVRAPKTGTIAKLRVKAGASLAADEIILDFLVEEEVADVVDAEKKAA